MKYGIALTLLVILAGCASQPTATPKAGQRYAIIETSNSRKVAGIFPVQIYNLDGQEINPAAERFFFQIDPGQHVIKARAFVDQNALRGLTRTIGKRDPIPPLVHNFQSGVRYFIGFKADSTDTRNGRLVIWKEEELKSGSLDLD